MENDIDLSSVLNDIVSRIEELTDEREKINEDIKLVFDEAKARKLNLKALKQLIKLRKTDSDEREELENILDIYKSAVGL